jgi:hypothetical protein
MSMRNGFMPFIGWAPRGICNLIPIGLPCMARRLSVIKGTVMSAHDRALQAMALATTRCAVRANSAASFISVLKSVRCCSAFRLRACKEFMDIGLRLSATCLHSSVDSAPVVCDSDAGRNMECSTATSCAGLPVCHAPAVLHASQLTLGLCRRECPQPCRTLYLMALGTTPPDCHRCTVLLSDAMPCTAELCQSGPEQDQGMQ